MFLLVGFWFVPLAATCQLQCVPGDLGDARFNGVVLEHFYRWLEGRETSLLNPQYFYPMPGALTFSDNHWGTAWIYTIFRALGWDRYQAYDLWFLFGCVLNFVVGHCVLRRLRFSPLASAVGAFAFAFAMPVTARYGHSQLGYRFLIPIGLLLWQSFHENGQWRWLGGFALAVAAQFYISIYLGYFMLLFLAAWALAQWRLEGWGPSQWFAQWHQYPQRAVRMELILALLMIAAAAVMIAVLMYPYIHYSKLYGFQRAAAEIASLLPRPQSYLLADSSALWGGLSQHFAHQIPMRHEQQMFFGIGILTFSVLALAMSKLRMRWVVFGSIFVLVVLTISIGGHSLYMLIAKLPGVGSIRAMARIGLVLALPAAILVAIAVDALRSRGVVGAVVLALLSAVMVVESASVHSANFDIGQARARDAQLRSSLPAILEPDALIFNPIIVQSTFYIDELDGVILAQTLGRPTLNGYSGNIPPGYDPRATLAPCEQAHARLEAAEHSPLLEHSVTTALSAKQPVVVGRSACDHHAVVFPLEEASRLALTILSLERAGPRLFAHVRVINHSDSVVNTSSDAPEPLHLSWQIADKVRGPDPQAWTPRISLEGGDILSPGESRDVIIAISGVESTGRAVFISAVLEGRAWLHEHGLQQAHVDLGTARQ